MGILREKGEAMQRSIFAVKAKGGSGKSKTVRSILCKILSSKYPKAKKDIFAVLTIGRMKIGIMSDCHKGRTERSLELFRNCGCKLIICATTTKGQSFDAVNGLTDYKMKKWFPLERAADKIMAQTNKIFNKRSAITR